MSDNCNCWCKTFFLYCIWTCYLISFIYKLFSLIYLRWSFVICSLSCYSFLSLSLSLFTLKNVDKAHFLFNRGSVSNGNLKQNVFVHLVRVDKGYMYIFFSEAKCTKVYTHEIQFNVKEWKIKDVHFFSFIKSKLTSINQINGTWDTIW